MSKKARFYPEIYSQSESVGALHHSVNDKETVYVFVLLHFAGRERAESCCECACHNVEFRIWGKHSCTLHTLEEVAIAGAECLCQILVLFSVSTVSTIQLH